MLVERETVLGALAAMSDEELRDAPTSMLIRHIAVQSVMLVDAQRECEVRAERLQKAAINVTPGDLADTELEAVVAAFIDRCGAEIDRRIPAPEYKAAPAQLLSALGDGIRSVSKHFCARCGYGRHVTLECPLSGKPIEVGTMPDAPPSRDE